MLFLMGRLVGTPSVIRFCDEYSINIIALVRRHLHGDWGDVCESDKKQNDDAVRTGDARIFSAYQFEQGKIWIITEWDRSVTTVLLPEEY